MGFRIEGLPGSTFRDFFSLDDEILAEMGMKRCIADEKPGFPCRVSMQDAEIGETLILGSYAHHSVDGPYRSSGPIFVRELATRQFEAINEVPRALSGRMLSVRAYDKKGEMQDAQVVDGESLTAVIERFFDRPAINFLHLHNAHRGCFACRVDRW